jgi:hypothetical protein
MSSRDRGRTTVSCRSRNSPVAGRQADQLGRRACPADLWESDEEHEAFLADLYASCRPRVGRDPGPRPGFAGGPRPISDARIAACCLVRELPLATLNIKDYADFTNTRASNSSSKDTRRGMPRGTNHSTREATRDTSREQQAQLRTPEGVRAHDIHRSPEAGAQVRILPAAPLPGAPRLTCDYYRKRPSELSGLAASWNQS